MDKAMHSEFEGHTPGPWKAVTVHGHAGNLVYCRILSDNYEHPGGMAYTTIPLKGKTKKQQELAGLYRSQGEQLAQYNAKLIAAAPDLLKENQLLRSELQKLKELNAEWIDVNERLPEENGLYLIHKTPDPDRMVEYLIDVIFYCKEKPFNRFVTHWMDLPKPPESLIKKYKES